MTELRVTADGRHLYVGEGEPDETWRLHYPSLSVWAPLHVKVEGVQAAVRELVAENERLRDALDDMASLMPADRWRLLHDATTDLLAAGRREGEG